LLGVNCGGLGGDCTYTIYKDYPEAQQVILPRVEDLPEGWAPTIYCILVDSANGRVRAIRTGCPVGFTRTWLAAIEAQKTVTYDETEERRWASEVMCRYPSTEALVHHPQAVVGKVNSYGRVKQL
jgi:hypothetical protein